MMAMYLTWAWTQIPLLAVFILTCWLIVLPGLANPLQIERRDLSERTSRFETDSPTSMTTSGRERSRDGRPRRLGSSGADSPNTTSDNFVSDLYARKSRKNTRKFDSDIKRTSTSRRRAPSRKHELTRDEFDVMAPAEDDSDYERTDMTSQSYLSMSINLDEYYTYDYDDYLVAEAEHEEEEDNDDEFNVDVAMEQRRKKEANSMGKEEWASLQRLAELATISNPELGFVNLITPNPDLDITIEVLVDGDSGGQEEHDEEVMVEADNRLPGDKRAPSTPAPPPRDPDEGKRGRKGDAPSAGAGAAGAGAAGALGDWSPWSACSVSCGGGKTERTRPCGADCRATETQECNKHICSGSSHFTSDNDIGVGESDPVFPFQPGFVIDVVDDITDASHNADFDSCEEWMQCRSERLVAYLTRLHDLPSCPCLYPSSILTNRPILDQHLGARFRWVGLDHELSRLDIYKPTASACIQSLLSNHSTSLAAQQCCYDSHDRLITRGQGAGTPQLISAEISRELHYKIDVLPWIVCKGDWTKYHRVRPPNNGRECRDVPDLQTFHSQVEDARNF